MRTIMLGSVLLGLLLIVFIGLDPYCNAADKPIELKVSTEHPSAKEQTKVIVEWTKKLTKESNGRLQFTIYPDSSLLSASETWDGTVRGVADISIGWVKGYGKEGMSPYHYGPVSWACAYGAKDVFEESKIGDELLKAFPPFAEEVAQLKLIGTFTLPNLVFYSGNFPIRSIDDFRGRTVRCGNTASSAFVKSVGGNPLFMSMGEVFLALQKGTMDIVAGHATNFKSHRHGDIARYVTISRVPAQGPGVGYIGMNWNTWRKLSPDLQKIIDASCEQVTYASRACRVTEYEEGMEYAKSKGAEIIKFTPESILSKLFQNAFSEGFTASLIRIIVSYPCTKALIIFLPEALTRSPVANATGTKTVLIWPTLINTSS